MLDEKQVAQWVAALTARDTGRVEVLEVSRCGLADEALRPLVALLLCASSQQSFLRLVSLDLSGNVLGNDGCAMLAESISALRSRPMSGLRSLALAGNRIGAAGAAALAEALFPELPDGTAEASAGSAEEYGLGLSDNPLGDAGVEAVAAVVSRKRCRAALFLCNVGLTGHGCIALNKCAPWLAGLDLGYNAVPIAKLEALVAVAGPCLSSLGLEHMGSADGGRSMPKDLVLEALADLLVSARAPLAELNLAQNSIQDAGMKKVVDAMAPAGATKLRELDVSGNRLRDGNVLSKLLFQGGERLTSLNLHGNELGDLAIVVLAAGISFAPTLRKLDLSRNRFGDEGMEALASAIGGQCDARADVAAPFEGVAASASSDDEVSRWLEDLAGGARGRSQSALWTSGGAEMGLLMLDVSVNLIMDRGAIALAEAMGGSSSSMTASSSRRKRPAGGASNLALVDLSENSVGASGREALESAVAASHRRVQEVLDGVAAGRSRSSFERLPRPLLLLGVGLEGLDAELATRAANCRVPAAAERLQRFGGAGSESHSTSDALLETLASVGSPAATLCQFNVDERPPLSSSPVSKEMLETLQEHEAMLQEPEPSEPIARALFRAKLSVQRAQTAYACAGEGEVVPSDEENQEARRHGGKVPCASPPVEEPPVSGEKASEFLRLQSEVAKLRKQVVGAAETVGAEVHEEPEGEAPSREQALRLASEGPFDFASAHARLERELAALREQVSRIDMTLTSMNPQPEEEVDMEDSQTQDETGYAEGVVNPLTGRARLPKRRSTDLWGDVGPSEPVLADASLVGGAEPEPEVVQAAGETRSPRQPAGDSSSSTEMYAGGSSSSTALPSADIAVAVAAAPAGAPNAAGGAGGGDSAPAPAPVVVRPELAALADFVNAPPGALPALPTPAPPPTAAAPPAPGELERPPVPEQMSMSGPAAATAAVAEASAAEDAAATPAKGAGKAAGKGAPPPPAPPPKGAGKGPPLPPKAPGAGGGKAEGKGEGGKAGAPKPKAKVAPKGGAQAKEGSAAPFHKKLYWKPLDIHDSEGTIFSAENRERRSSIVNIDTEALARMFEAEKEKGNMDRRKSSGLLSKAQRKMEGTKLLSDHRARNIAIIFRRLPVTTADLIDMLTNLTWESQGLSTDDLEQILEVIPTKEEGEKLREHRGPEARAKLRDVEQMVLPLALLNRSAARVRVLCIARGSKSMFSSTMRSLAAIRVACGAIQRSAALQEVMWLALDLGNFINHGDSSKGAKAITIGSLVTLKDFKTGKMSSLHFLCACLLRGEPNRDFHGELMQELRAAFSLQNLQIVVLQSQARNFQRDFEVVKAECGNFLHEYTGGPAPEASPQGSPRTDAPLKSGKESPSADDDEPRSLEDEDDDSEVDDTTGGGADSARFVEDVMKIRGSPGRRLKNMLRVVEKLCKLMREDLDTTIVQVQKTLKFCGMGGPSAAMAAAKAAAGHPNMSPAAAAVARGKELPQDLEVLLTQLAEFCKVFKQHWDDVKLDMASYQQFFGDPPSTASGGRPPQPAGSGARAA